MKKEELNNEGNIGVNIHNTYGDVSGDLSTNIYDKLFRILANNNEEIKHPKYKKITKEEELDKYEGFTKTRIKVWGKKQKLEKEIYLEDENLKIDSTNWKEITISGISMKVNPKGDVVEFLEGVEKGEQLFSYYSALREAKKAGKRLLSHDELFGVIHGKGVEEFMKFFPGCVSKDLLQFYSRNDIVYYRVKNKEFYNNSISIVKPRYILSKYVKPKNNDLTGIMCAEYIDKNTLFSIRCAKD